MSGAKRKQTPLEEIEYTIASAANKMACAVEKWTPKCLTELRPLAMTLSDTISVVIEKYWPTHQAEIEKELQSSKRFRGENYQGLDAIALYILFLDVYVKVKKFVPDVKISLFQPTPLGFVQQVYTGAIGYQSYRPNQAKWMHSKTLKFVTWLINDTSPEEQEATRKKAKEFAQRLLTHNDPRARHLFEMCNEIADAHLVWKDAEEEASDHDELREFSAMTEAQQDVFITSTERYTVDENSFEPTPVEIQWFLQKADTREEPTAINWNRIRSKCRIGLRKFHPDKTTDGQDLKNKLFMLYQIIFKYYITKFPATTTAAQMNDIIDTLHFSVLKMELQTRV